MPKKPKAPHAAQNFARHIALLLPGQRLRLDLGLDKAAHLGAQQFVLFREIGRASAREPGLISAILFMAASRFFLFVACLFDFTCGALDRVQRSGPDKLSSLSARNTLL